MKKYILVIITIVFSFTMKAQNVKDSIVGTYHFRIGYAYQTPGGDMADRFGNNSNIEFAFNRKTKTNVFFGISTTFLFGRNVSEPGLMQNLYTEQGHIVANDGKISRILIQERGYTISLEGGKLFNSIGKNPNSGILMKGGVGFLQHKIRLEHQFDEITQLEGEYLKGYDRLTNGLLINEFVGYFHQGNRKLINFYIGMEAHQAFTSGRRDFNFDTQTVDNSSRTDLLYGFRVGWIIHLYGQSNGGEYYY